MESAAKPTMAREATIFPITRSVWPRATRQTPDLLALGEPASFLLV